MPKQTYKCDIAIEYCEKYIDFSTRAIARRLIKDHPLDFTESNAKSVVLNMLH